jgi:hypothetical protein
MGPRNLLILFFSTVAVSLVILIIFFSLFFKNVDLNFNTRLPESAPDIGHQYATGPSMNPDSKADGLMRPTVNVPPEMQEPPPGSTAKKKSDDEAASDSDLPPVSDDAVLEHDNTAPITDPALDTTPPQSTSKDTASRSDGSSAPSPRALRPAKRPTDLPPPPMPAPPPPADESAPVDNGPPVPGQ